MATLAVSQKILTGDQNASDFGYYISDIFGATLSEIQDHAYDYPEPPVCLTIEMLNHFAAGDAEADIPSLSRDLEMELFELVRWWSSLQGLIGGMWHNNPAREQEGPPVPGLDSAESAMKRVRLALAAVITDTPEEDNPLPEFLRAYRLWTRSICEMGRQGWPGIDWSYLDEVV